VGPSGRVSDVDMQASIEDTRRMRREAGDDLLCQELWSTYAVLGELLLTGPGEDHDAYLAEYQDLVGRLIELGDQIRRRDEQLFAAWLADITTDGG
jgi:hypothetical protein